MRDVYPSRPSDNPEAFPYTWIGYFHQDIVNHGSWYLSVGYAAQKESNKHEAYSELRKLCPELEDQQPKAPDLRGVCVYRLLDNGTTGYAANLVIGCKAGAIYSREAKQLWVNT